MHIDRFIKLFLMSLAILFLFPLSSFSQNNTTEEIMTFETYYPAPYGVYNEMRSKRMAVGDNYYNGSQFYWPSGGSSGNIDSDADLIVEGNVGIGTSSPPKKLTIEVPPASYEGLMIRRTGGAGNRAELRVGGLSQGSLELLDDVGTSKVFLHASTGTPGEYYSYFMDPVGIGNTYSTYPTAKLDVRYAEAAALPKGLVYFGNSGANALTTLTLGDSGYTNTRYLLKAVADTDADMGGPYDVFTIRSDGNVGIGTANPQAKLHIINEVGDGIMFGTPNVRQWKFELENGAPLNIKDVTGNYVVAQFAGNWTTSDIYLWPRNSVGIGATPMPIGPTYKLYVAGAVYATGGYQPSDLRFKQDIMAINNPLDKVLSLKGISFEWKKEEYKEKNFPQGRHFGIIGQEIEKVLPEIVNLDQDGSRNVNYQEIIPVLIEAVKEQQKQIEELKQRLSTVEKKK